MITVIENLTSLSKKLKCVGCYAKLTGRRLDSLQWTGETGKDGGRVARTTIIISRLITSTVKMIYAHPVRLQLSILDAIYDFGVKVGTWAIK